MRRDDLVKTMISKLRDNATLPYWGYLLAATMGEIASVYVPLLGLGIYAALLMCMLVHGVMAQNERRANLALALAPAPLIRLLSLTMPLFEFPQVVWYPMVAVPLMVSVWLTARQASYTRVDLGLRIGHVPSQLLLILFGPALGIAEYLILRPTPLAPSLDPYEVGFYSLVLLIFTGLNEELIFRGLMQTAAIRVLGRWALLFVSILFGVLHMGYLSVLDLVFVTGVGLAFAYFVRWGGSIFGVTLAHGITNITLFIVAPIALADATSGEAIVLFTVAGVGALLATIGAVQLRRRYARGLHSEAERDTQTESEKIGEPTVAHKAAQHEVITYADVSLTSTV